MRVGAGHVSPWAEWAWAAEPLRGEPEPADRAVVVPRPDGFVAAAVDGLGHGPDAVAAARLAIETIEARAAAPLMEILAACHAALQATRGAVLSLAVVDGPRAALAWTGVGDVEAILQPASRAPRQSLMLAPGVVGDRLPPVRSHAAQLDSGDLIVFATDGVRRSFVDELVAPLPPLALAERILARHSRGTDDALSLVVRYSRTP